MTDAALEAAARTLGRRIGLRVDGASRMRLERALREAAQERGVTPDAYAATLGVDAAELHRFIDRVTVQESAFFRHERHFAALATLLPTLGARGTIWSAGCANGQEPWSLAMLLDELPAPGWNVVASDISIAALARAKSGIYEERALRGLHESRRERHMRRGDDGRWSVRAHLRPRVRFLLHNLVEDVPPVAPAACRVVMCRNVLIYFRHEETQRVLRRMHELLAPDGVLIVGGAEALVGSDIPFRADWHDGTFVYRPDAWRPPEPAAAPAPAPAPAPAVVPPTERRAATDEALPTVEELLARGEDLMARGEHSAAIAIYRQAAYLDPDDPRAHYGLALALERSGARDASARALRAAQAAERRQEARP